MRTPWMPDGMLQMGKSLASWRDSVEDWVREWKSHIVLLERAAVILKPLADAGNTEADAIYEEIQSIISPSFRPWKGGAWAVARKGDTVAHLWRPPFPVAEWGTECMMYPSACGSVHQSSGVPSTDIGKAKHCSKCGKWKEHFGDDWPKERT